jgi:hypothetical protein
MVIRPFFQLALNPGNDIVIDTKTTNTDNTDG